MALLVDIARVASRQNPVHRLVWEGRAGPVFVGPYRFMAAALGQPSSLKSLRLPSILSKRDRGGMSEDQCAGVLGFMEACLYVSHVYLMGPNRSAMG